MHSSKCDDLKLNLTTWNEIKILWRKNVVLHIELLPSCYPLEHSICLVAMRNVICGTALPWSLSSVRSRHDGLHHQLSPLLPVVSHDFCLCEGCVGPLRDVVSPPLLRPARSSLAFVCSPEFCCECPSVTYIKKYCYLHEKLGSCSV